MTQTRFGRIVPILILLLVAIACGPFSNATKPTQVVDISPMIGKSLQEMTTLLGPPKDVGICHGWDVAEGQLSVCYQSGDHQKKLMENLHYRLPPAPFFAARIAAATPEEMAALVKIDLQGRKPDTEIRGGYGYDNFILNGKPVDLFFDGGPKTIVGVRVDVKPSAAPAATNDSQASTSTLNSTAGVTMANFNRLQKGMTYAQAVQVLGKEGKKESVMEAGGTKIEMYKWDVAENTQATMSVFFKDGMLDTKFQFGLK